MNTRRRASRFPDCTLNMDRLHVMMDGVRFGVPSLNSVVELVIPRWWDLRRVWTWLFESPGRIEIHYIGRTKVHRARLVSSLFS